MEKYITSEPAEGPFPRTPFFEPLFPSSSPSTTSSLQQPAPKLEFHLIIHDPGSDSSFTPGWTVPNETIKINSTASIGELLSQLRNELPPSSSPSPSPSTAVTKASTSTATTASNDPLASSRRRLTANGGSDINATGSSPFAMLKLPSLPKGARPKLKSVTLFILRADIGTIHPLCRDKRDWIYRGGIARAELLDKTEGDWRVCRELLCVAPEAFKCYIAVQGEEGRLSFGKRQSSGRKGLFSWMG